MELISATFGDAPTEARLEDEKGTLESCSGIRRTFALLRQRF